MNTVSITAAIVSGFFALCAAIIAFIQNSRVEKIKADAQVALEKLKAENSRRSKIFEVARNEAEPIENALSKAWEDLQVIKDVIFKLLAPARYDADIALSRLKEAAESLEYGYAKWGNRIPEYGKRAWHSAKFVADEVADKVQQSSAVGKTEPILSSQIVMELREHRIALGDYQMVLAAERSRLRDLMIDRILEQM